MKNIREYKIIIKEHDGADAFVAIIPDLNGLSGYGDTPEEALRELMIAKRLFLEVMEESK